MQFDVCTALPLRCVTTGPFPSPTTSPLGWAASEQQGSLKTRVACPVSTAPISSPKFYNTSLSSSISAGYGNGRRGKQGGESTWQTVVRYSRNVYCMSALYQALCPPGDRGVTVTPVTWQAQWFGARALQGNGLVSNLSSVTYYDTS